MPSVMFDVDPANAKGSGLKGLSEEDLEAVDALKTVLDISTVEVYKYYQTFRQFDRDGSGELDISELKQVFSTLGVKVHDESIKLLMASIDEDESGEVDFKEFLQMMVSQKQKLDQDEELEEAYKVFVLSRFDADACKCHRTPQSAPAACGRF